MVLSREAVLEAVERRASEATTFSVPEWGGDVLVRRLSPKEVEATGLTDNIRDAGMFARLVAACLVDEDGGPLFTTADVEALQRADVESLTRVFLECIRVNGLSNDELEAAAASFANAQPDSSSTS
jgi:hypothetical protein